VYSQACQRGDEATTTSSTLIERLGETFGFNTAPPRAVTQPLPTDPPPPDTIDGPAIAGE